MNPVRPGRSWRAAVMPLCLSGAVLGGLAGCDAGAADAAYGAGSQALHDKDYSTAIAQLERAAALRAEHVDTWFKLGMAHSALEQWDEAIRAYRRALEIDPTHARAQHNLANVHFRRGELELAAEAYGAALALDPQYALAAFHYGWTLRQLGRSEEAEQAFRACLELPAEDPRAQHTRVDCLFGLGSIRHRAADYAGSASMMEEVLRFHPVHPEARHYLGLAYRQLGRLAEAEQQLEFHEQMLRARRTSGAAGS